MNIQLEIGLGLLLYFTLWYLFTTLIKNAGLIDIGWGLGFVLLSTYVQLRMQMNWGWLLWGMVSLWGIRLALHIGRRNLGKAEDYRYAQFRKDWGKTFWLRAYVQLFLFQGLLMGIIAQSYLEGQSHAVPMYPLLMGIGSLLFILGFWMEAEADASLKRHIQDPQNKGHLIQTGLWAISRHPNYLGESILWLGIALTSIGLGGPIWSLLGFITISLIIRYVSGVPLLEKRLMKYPEYSEYIRKVPIFIPFIQPKGGS